MGKLNRSPIRSIYVSSFFILFILSILRNVELYSQTDTTEDKKWSVGIYGGKIFPNQYSTLVSDVYSQSDTSQPHRWSATAFIGESLPFDYDSYLNSINTGIEINYNYNPSIAIFFNGSFYFLRLGKDHINYTSSEQLVETSIGTKIYFNPGHDRIFMQFGLGDYQLLEHHDYGEYGGGTYTYNIDKFGVSVGLGSDIHIYKNLNATINTKLHFVGFISGEQSLMYWGINTGIKYYF